MMKLWLVALPWRILHNLRLYFIKLHYGLRSYLIRYDQIKPWKSRLQTFNGHSNARPFKSLKIEDARSKRKVQIIERSVSAYWKHTRGNAKMSIQEQESANHRKERQHLLNAYKRKCKNEHIGARMSIQKTEWAYLNKSKNVHTRAPSEGGSHSCNVLAGQENKVAKLKH